MTGKIIHSSLYFVSALSQSCRYPLCHKSRYKTLSSCLNTELTQFEIRKSLNVHSTLLISNSEDTQRQN